MDKTYRQKHRCVLPNFPIIKPSSHPFINVGTAECAERFRRPPRRGEPGVLNRRLQLSQPFWSFCGNIASFPNILFQIPESEILNPLLYPPPGPAHSAGRRQVGAPRLTPTLFSDFFGHPNNHQKNDPSKNCIFWPFWWFSTNFHFNVQRFGSHFGSQFVSFLAGLFWV